MASVVVQESSKDIPRLSLSVEHTASSSPFPSPGSPFLPPPRLGAHEFASKPSTIESLMRNINTKRKSKESVNGTTLSLEGDATPTVTSPLSPPVTPTPTTTFQVRPPSPTVVTIPPPPQTPGLAPERHAQTISLSSSRPAPPSPAASRRASAALSTLSRHSSIVKSRPASRIVPSSIQVNTDKRASTSSATPLSKPRTLLLKIRDFAFPSSDDRHIGKGPYVPRENRPRYRGSTYSTSSSSACGDEEDEDQQNGWGSFRWNTLSAHFWNGKNSNNNDGAGDGDPGPSQMDFERNFDSEETSEDQDYYSADGGPEQYEDDGGYPTEDEPLLPGTYRALYAFEPEGTAEMALEEEQIVHVVGKGGGVGWAVVVKEDGGHALVPESYLELVEASPVVTSEA